MREARVWPISSWARRRSNGGNGPLPFLFDFEKEDFHDRALFHLAADDPAPGSRPQALGPSMVRYSWARRVAGSISPINRIRFLVMFGLRFRSTRWVRTNCRPAGAMMPRSSEKPVCSGAIRLCDDIVLSSQHALELQPAGCKATGMAFSRPPTSSATYSSRQPYLACIFSAT